ncbi:MAG: sulfonate ABC transporter substrate-binding protein [Cytophagales bacterium]|nr:sulfonate ABC transporter substrate-binding protein [Armatimonadota bacterium]
MPRHYFLPSRLLLTVIPALLATGCGFTGGRDGSAASSGTGSTRNGVLHIGYQKGGAPNVLRIQGGLDRRLAKQGVRVEWISFPAGPQMLEAVGVGSIDLGSTGDAPPIFAQAAGLPIVYVANQPPGEDTARAILVAQDSPIRTVADLRGKRIAVQKGSGTHNFLVQALEKAGVPYDQVRVSYLAPPDARAAFDAGSIDAWAIWDPFLSVAQEKTHARVIADGRGIVSAGGFYLSSRSFAASHTAWLRVALEELDRTGIWIAKNPDESARLLAKDLGVDPKVLMASQRRVRKGDRYVGFRPIDDAVMTAQQQVADNFWKIRLLPRRVEVRTGLLTPQQYAAITPAAAGKALPVHQEARK